MLKVTTYEHVYDAQDRYESDCAEELVQELISGDVEFNRVITPQFIRITWRDVLSESVD